IDALGELDDQRGLTEAWRLYGLAMRRRGRMVGAQAAFGRASGHAASCGDRATRRRLLGWVALALGDGPVPAVEAVHQCQPLIRRQPGDGALEAAVGYPLAALLAMAGRVDESRAVLDDAGRVFEELDLTGTLSSLWRTAAEAREFAGDRAGAEHELE